MPSVDVDAIRRRGASLFAGFTSGQKAMLAIAAMGTLLGGMLFLRWSSTDNYVPLYANLPAADAAEVTTELDSMGIPFRLADGGGTIHVPSDQVYRARLDLSAAGLPRDGAPGYDLLDNQGITTSEFRQRVDYQRALQGELSRTIQAIDGVEAATVHLVIPEDDLFSGDDQHPSASVLVRTRPGVSLTAGQVQAVVHLVASSVEGLSAEQVTLADGTGRVLAAPGTDGMSAAAGDARAAQTASFETNLAQEIEALLLPVTGPNRARVQVSADLDFDRRAVTTERFDDPGTSPVISQSETNETFEGSGGAAAGGVLGADGLPVDAGEGDSNYQRTNAETAFAVGKVTETVETAPGDVQRLSIAVLVDQAAGIDTIAVEQLVRAAAGLDAARGDSLEVTQLTFDTSAAAAAQAELDAAAAEESQAQLFSLLRTVGAIVIVAIVLFLAYRSSRKAAVERYPLAIELDLADPDERGLPAGRSNGARARADGSASPDAIAGVLSELDAPRPDVLSEDLTDLVDQQPDDVALVLRSWLAERSG